MSTREIYAFPTTLSILRKYAQMALWTKTPLSRGVTGKTFTDREKRKKNRPSVRVHWVACGTCSLPGNFFQVGVFSSWGVIKDHLSAHPQVIPAEALWLTRPHTFVRRNTSFSEVKNLATGLLINHLSEKRNSCPL